MSIGRANIPTPPNITKSTQPKNDIIAIMYTANEVSNVKVLAEVMGLGTVKALFVGVTPSDIISDT